MLEILGQSKNPLVIQMHLKKLFSGIHKVEFNKDNSFILAMISSNNENVQLLNKIQVDEIVESWLNILAKTMVDTLVKSTNECSAEKQLELNKYSHIKH